MGPLNDAMKSELDAKRQGDINYDVSWTTLGEYLDCSRARGISTNVASLRRRDHGARSTSSATPTAPRRRRSSRACARWCARRWTRARSASRSALIYAPAFYAKTDELIALCKVAADYGGHVHLAHAQRGQPAARGGRRSARDRAARRDVPAEIYHLKAAGATNWPQARTRSSRKIEAARAAGLAHHRRHVHLHRRRHRARRGDAALGAGGRARGLGRAAARSRRSAPGSLREMRHADRRLGEPATRRPGRRSGCCWSAFKQRRAQAADRQDPRRGGARCAARRPRRPRWTW